MASHSLSGPSWTLLIKLKISPLLCLSLLDVFMPVTVLWLNMSYTYLLTYSRKHSPSWEANRFAASQEIPRILWKKRGHYRSHKCSPPVYTLRKIDPVHTTFPTSWRFILILSSLYGWASQVDSFPQGFPPKPCIRLSCPPYAPHASPISFFSMLSPAKYWVSSTYHYAPLYKVFPLPCYLVPVRLKYSP